MKSLRYKATLIAIVVLAIAGTANAQLKSANPKTAKLYISLHTGYSCAP